MRMWGTPPPMDPFPQQDSGPPGHWSPFSKLESELVPVPAPPWAFHSGKTSPAWLALRPGLSSCFFNWFILASDLPSLRPAHVSPSLSSVPASVCWAVFPPWREDVQAMLDGGRNGPAPAPLSGRGPGSAPSPEPGACGRPPCPSRFPGLEPCGAFSVETQPSAWPKRVKSEGAATGGKLTPMRHWARMDRGGGGLQPPLPSPSLPEASRTKLSSKGLLPHPHSWQLIATDENAGPAGHLPLPWPRPETFCSFQVPVGCSFPSLASIPREENTPGQSH